MSCKSHVQLSCTTTSLQWLNTVLLPKLNKWASSSLQSSSTTNKKGLKLIDTERYYKKYTSLKDIYGRAITEVIYQNLML